MTTDHKVRYERYKGSPSKWDTEEKERIRRSELYQQGDTILVWVNEGDLMMCGLDMGEAPETREARDLVERLCADPEMWATHGRPGEAKLAILEREIAGALRRRNA